MTLIDSNERVLEESIGMYDVMAVYGNCASLDVLKQAGAEDADLLIAATVADEINLLSCMTAHGLNRDLKTIARIRNPEYTEQIYRMQDAFGLSLSVNPEKQTADEIENLLKYPSSVKRESFAKGRVQIVELPVEEGSRLDGCSLSGLVGNILGFPVLVCIVQRQGKTIVPRGDFVLEGGDRIFVTAPSLSLEQLLGKLDMVQNRVSKVLLAGGSRIAYYLASALTRGGIDVTLVEGDLKRCEELAAQLPRANVIHGDPSDRRLLESEGLPGCDALVTLTDSDETNLVLSMIGHSMGIRRIITKLSSEDNASLLGNLPIGSVVCPGVICCRAITRYVSAMYKHVGDAVSVHDIAYGQAQAMELKVKEGERFLGIPLRDLKMKPGVIVSCISNGMKTEIPKGDSRLNAGDTVVIVSTGDTEVRKLSDIFA